MTRRRRVILRAGFWCGVVVAALSAAAWVGSYWNVIWYSTSSSGLFAGVSHGRALAVTGKQYSPSGLRMLGFENWITFLWPPWDFFSSQQSASGMVYFFDLPLWMPLASGVGLAAFARWRLRRGMRLAGHCPCGYDLRGLKGRVCPECGRASRGVEDPPRRDAAAEGNAR